VHFVRVKGENRRNSATGSAYKNKHFYVNNNHFINKAKRNVLF
jgi:hypothetical protein